MHFYDVHILYIDHSCLPPFSPPYHIFVYSTCLTSSNSFHQLLLRPIIYQRFLQSYISPIFSITSSLFILSTYLTYCLYNCIRYSLTSSYTFIPSFIQPSLPHIHLSVLVPASFRFVSFFLFHVQHSNPCIIAGSKRFYITLT